MLKADFKKHIFQFKQPGGTSRGVLHVKSSWYIRVWDENDPACCGIGECSVLPGLSPDDRPDIETKLKEVCRDIENYAGNASGLLADWPAIRFALECALLDLHNGGKKIVFPSAFTKGADSIAINGLIWMGEPEFMLKQIETKLANGFSCLKMKIGAIDFDQELQILSGIRKRFSSDELALRVDANGAFQPASCLEKLERLAKYQIHSIEQPIMAGQWEAMATLCERTPLPIALDEELIGIVDRAEKEKMLKLIQPQYIIIKPSLTGGFQSSDEWIELAGRNNVGWWITSALEGNVGLNAIAQWTFLKNNPLPQGLGTGQVFTNNIDSPLWLEGERLKYNPAVEWADI
ncbi:MAG: o-succinylbenzoate synthase [Marinilabiliaceae bacterium]|nr:o-succinylbenzoate synthase [Marinilabiliaceae bacterium]